MKKILFLLLFLPVIVAAHPPPEPPPLERGKPKKMIHAIRIWKLTEELDLSEEQLAKFLPKLNRLDDTKEEFHKKRADAIKEMRHLLESEKVSEKELKKKIGEIEGIRKEFEKEKDKTRAEIKKILTIPQQARFIIFQEKFERHMKEIIRDIKKHRRIERRRWD